ncbi:patatin-like phospholipase family protein [Bradyrhizobium ottawaense]|uniref:patatin-like phospholipase family protein n=1 Tax=Bradyrhizobium ottawaense TaxID=931866 RepID=UPI003FA190D3
MAKTSFFKSCLGVFQGGGCRAAAFVGAYEEAINSGVSFAEVAGTSAGAIMAALIGAGASPSQLKQVIAAMDFKAFLAEPERKESRGVLGKLLAAKYPKYADLAFDQGFHSSLPIKTWMEKQLADLLPGEKHPVTFRSLQFPTYIISTDLSRSEAKIWSQATTPNDLVSDAVQASCAIPIFFQPINRRFVDGGVISNLPSFVFFGREDSQRALASRVLAFTLRADELDPNDWGTHRFLEVLANALVDGGQQLQLSLQNDVHVVTIPTGKVKATDFESVTPEITQELIRSGSSATRSFFEQELLKVQPPSSTESVCYGSDELFTRVTESLDIPLDRIVVADHNTDWVYSLFPSLLCWRVRGVKVDVLLPALGDKADGVYRRRLLRAMGAHVTEIPNETAVPIRAVVIVPRDVSQLRAVVGVEKQSKSQTIDAIYYQGFLNTAAIRAILGQLDSQINAPQAAPFTPTFESDGHDLLLKRIRSVRQYSKAGIDISIENVPIDRLVSLTRFVREYKYRQIAHLIRLYRQSNLPLFDTAMVRLGMASSIVTPPVVEEAGGRFILVEGSTRATFCRDEGASQIKCVVVRGVTDPLPSVAVEFKRVRVVGRTLEAAERYERFNYEHFRSIERAVHPFDSLT